MEEGDPVAIFVIVDYWLKDGFDERRVISDLCLSAVGSQGSVFVVVATKGRTKAYVNEQLPSLSPAPLLSYRSVHQPSRVNLLANPLNSGSSFVPPNRG